MSKDMRDYRDLLDRPHPESKKHPRMSRESRAAQFSPFASLKGYEELIEEGARDAEEKYGREDREEFFD
ncbi:MAG: hypothetical protein J5493_02550 [Lachnospiraceae bacterium]|nr:hypothetical protein [Lachnospiraceae bacterium]